MTPERPIKFAVAGLGRIGERHVRQAVRIDGFELTAVCDTSKEVRKKFAAAVDFEGFKTFDDYRKMLDAGLADVAVIATPSHLHYEMTLAALDAGCNVLVESKPRRCLPQPRKPGDSLRYISPFVINLTHR